MITPLFVLFSKTILTQEVTMDFYFLINCSTSLYNRPKNLSIYYTVKGEKCKEKILCMYTLSLLVMENRTKKELPGQLFGQAKPA